MPDRLNPEQGHLLRHGHAGAGTDRVFFAIKIPATGGEDGLQGIPQGRLFGLIDLSASVSVDGLSLPLNLYYFIYALFCVCLWLFRRGIVGELARLIKRVG